MVTILWIVVSYGTLSKLVNGELLFAPCLKDFEGKKALAEKHFDEKSA